jgi:hypothetical protein
MTCFDLPGGRSRIPQTGRITSDTGGFILLEIVYSMQVDTINNGFKSRLFFRTPLPPEKR